MRDSDWSRENLLRSDWLGLIVATMTTRVYFESTFFPVRFKWALKLYRKCFYKINKGDTLTLTLVGLVYNTHVLILFCIMPIF